MELTKLTAKLIKLNLVCKLYSSSKLSELHLNFSQMPILGYIYYHPKCTQVEIAEELSVSPASITLSTKRLEKSGMIVKETDNDNLRCKRLSLTEEGTKAFLKGHDIRDEQDVQMYRDFSYEELELLNSFIDRMTMNLTKEETNEVDVCVLDDLTKEIDKISAENK